jgi:hypothetical protein
MAERLARAVTRLKEIEEQENIKIIVALGADDEPIVIDLRNRENSTLPEWATQYWPKKTKTSTGKPAKNSKSSTLPASSSRRSSEATRRSMRRGRRTER